VGWGGIDAFGEILAPSLLCPPQIRQNPDLSSENPMASRVSYAMASTIVESDVPAAELNAGNSLSAGAGQMNVVFGKV